MPRWTNYTGGKLAQLSNELFRRIYSEVSELDVTAYWSKEPLPYAKRRSGKKLTLRVGDRWGGLFDCAWFNFRGRVPRSARGQNVVLLIDVSGELCLFDTEGVPVRGLTTKASTFGISPPGKRIVQVARKATGSESVNVWADGGCNDLFGNTKNEGRVMTASIAVCDEQMRDLAFDFCILRDFWRSAPKGTPRSKQIHHALQSAASALRDFTPKEVRQARRILAPELVKKNGDASLHISALGHAHLDLAWLWPERETHRKAARTFSTVLELLDRYPEYHFGASQPQQYRWIQEEHPALYDRIRQKVKQGRIEPLGAMWVESDTNIPSGESLVRQLLYGKRFFRREFGVDTEILWLPDAFGFSAALPQLMKLAGLKYFMTMKLSWSRVNTFPHHSFHWQGIDGTKVLSHMLPEGNYNGSALPEPILKIEESYQDADVSDQALMCFGIGDGGGGPGAEHLESLKRVKNFAGLPKVEQRSAAEFFQLLAKDEDSFATWVGGLYVENHQGTYTTQARSKWYNRRVEQMLRELEWTAACVTVSVGAAYPRKELLRIWERILFLQFHDILPGSSIRRVHDEAKADYAGIVKELEKHLKKARATIAKQLDTNSLRKPHLVANSLNWERNEWVKLEDGWQRVTAPPMSFTVVDAETAVPEFPELKATSQRLENECLRVHFNKYGAISRIFDKKARRDVLAGGAQANRLAVYKDAGDAWDFPVDYADTEPRMMVLESSAATVDGPRAVVSQRYRLGYSVLEQEISLTDGSALIEFSTRTTWRETATMLRTAFPVDILAKHATCEIQFGSLERPVHDNTTWDLAQTEVPAQRWADLSQGNYGVALLNDSKYGYKVKGGILDLCLLRSVPYTGERVFDASDLKPGDPNHIYGDQEEHEFRYALLPHAGDHVSGDVVRTAWSFNMPLHVEAVKSHSGTGATFPSIQVDSDTVIVEAVKLAEDRDSVIVRLYESSGAPVSARISFGRQIASIHEVNLLEEPIKLLRPGKKGLSLKFGGFQIRTLEVDFK